MARDGKNNLKNWIHEVPSCPRSINVTDGLTNPNSKVWGRS